MDRSENLASEYVNSKSVYLSTTQMVNEEDAWEAVEEGYRAGYERGWDDGAGAHKPHAEWILVRAESVGDLFALQDALKVDSLREGDMIIFHENADSEFVYTEDDE